MKKLLVIVVCGFFVCSFVVAILMLHKRQEVFKKRHVVTQVLTKTETPELIRDMLKPLDNLAKMFDEMTDEFIQAEQALKKYDPYIKKAEGTEFYDEFIEVLDDFSINYLMYLVSGKEMKKYKKELKEICNKIDALNK